VFLECVKDDLNAMSVLFPEVSANVNSSFAKVSEFPTRRVNGASKTMCLRSQISDQSKFGGPINEPTSI